MGDPHERLFQLARAGPEAWGPRSADSRKRWLLRMLVLLGASCLAFSLTAVWLSRLSAYTSAQNANSGAVEVVRAHFAALHRGDFRAAYSLFSSRLRREVPFEEFQDIMKAHRSLLRGKVSVFPEMSSRRRVVVAIDFHPRGHIDVTAEFTLVRSGGRWWIDHIHWDLERLRPRHVMYA